MLQPGTDTRSFDGPGLPPIWRAAICVLALAGCQSFFSGYATETYANPDGQERIVRMTGNYLGGAFSLPGKVGVYSAQLNLQKTAFVDQQAAVFSFYVRLYDVDYVEIKSGSSLELRIDGQRYSFEGLGSAKLRGAYDENLIQEAAYYHKIPDDALRALYHARSVRIRIAGERRELSFFCTEKNRANFRRFIRDEHPEIARDAQ
jgi:hypothetical protein